MSEPPMPTGVLIGLALVFIGCMLVAAGWITCIVITDCRFRQQGRVATVDAQRPDTNTEGKEVRSR